jgi:hypothetical protein
VEMDQVINDEDFSYIVSAAGGFTVTATKLTPPCLGSTVTVDAAGTWGGTYDACIDAL